MEVLVDRRTGHRLVPFGTPSIQFADWDLLTFAWNPNGPQHNYGLYDGARPMVNSNSFQRDFWNVFGEERNGRLYSRPGNNNVNCQIIRQRQTGVKPPTAAWYQ